MRKIIKTRRFTLRPFRMSDAASIAKNINHRQIARNLLTVPFPYTIKDARKHLKLTLKRSRKRKHAPISLAIDIDGEVVGAIGLFRVTSHKAEMGYWLTHRLWGQGIMAEAVKKMTSFAFNELGLHRVYAHVFYFNKASMRVLEKAGFAREGILRKHDLKGKRLVDSHLFARVR